MDPGGGGGRSTALQAQTTLPRAVERAAGGGGDKPDGVAVPSLPGPQSVSDDLAPAVAQLPQRARVLRPHRRLNLLLQPPVQGATALRLALVAQPVTRPQQLAAVPGRRLTLTGRAAVLPHKGRQRRQLRPAAPLVQLPQG